MIVRESAINKMEEFLLQIEGKEMIWGEDDCTMNSRNWVQFATGINVPSLGYTSREEAHRLIDEYGGLCKIWREFMSPFFNEAAEPEFGDVGIIHTRLSGDIGAIFVHGGIAALRLEAGYRFLTPNPKYIKQVWSLKLCDS